MSRLDAILGSLQLEHLRVSFEQEGVSIEDVPELDEGHLAALGVTRLGDRVRLRRAIEAVLAGPEPAWPVPSPPPVTPADRALMGITWTGLEAGPPAPAAPELPRPAAPSVLPLPVAPHPPAVSPPPAPAPAPAPTRSFAGDEARRALRREELHVALEAWAHALAGGRAARREADALLDSIERARHELERHDPAPHQAALEAAQARSRQASESTVTFLRRLVRKDQALEEEAELERLEARYAEAVEGQRAGVERLASMERELAEVSAALEHWDSERARGLVVLAAKIGADPWSEVDDVPMALRPDLLELFVPMVRIGPHSFWMGSPEDEPERYLDEALHEVTLSRPFAVARHPVTQALWKTVMGQPAGTFVEGADAWTRPVEGVSWFDAVRFCNALSGRLALEPAYRIGGVDSEVLRVPGANGFRLPTEAEWECAARAGTSHRYSGGDHPDRVAWYKDNSGRSTHPVGTKVPNAWGLADMSGNVAEWCEDLYAPASPAPVTDPCALAGSGQRVVRGGSWRMPASHLRVAARYRIDPSYALDTVGFRLAVSLD